MFNIKVDDLTSEAIFIFLQEHLDDMRATSPPESVHALDLDELKDDAVTFWSIWDKHSLIGCGALKKLDDQQAEIKSMRTARTYKKQGVASQLLKHIIKEAELAGYQTLSLETGSMAFFKPARCLYEKHGFDYCEPFADYIEDPNSVFMSLDLNRQSNS